MELNGAHPQQSLQTLKRCFDVLGAFTRAESEITPTCVAELTGLDRTTVHRFLRTLVELNIVERAQTAGRYRLGLRILDFSAVVLDSLEVRRAALPHLFHAHEENALLALVVQAGTESMIIERLVDANYVLRRSMTPLGYIAPGNRNPLDRSAAGRVIVAFLSPCQQSTILNQLASQSREKKEAFDLKKFRAHLSEVTARGYDTSDGGLVDGVQALAVPIFGTEGTAVGAIMVATHATQTIETFTEHWLDEMSTIASRISFTLGSPTALPHAR